MAVILVGLGYLLLAAAGAACWGLALAGSGHRPGAESPARTTSLLVTGGLAALMARSVVVWLLAETDFGFAQEKAVVGLPISRGGIDSRSILWWMPHRGAVMSARRDGLTAGAFAAAASASVAEIVLTVAIGAPVGAAAAVVVLAAVVGTGTVAFLVRTGRARESRRPAFAAGAAAVAVIVGVGVVAFVTMSGAAALQTGGFGPAAAHPHGSEGVEALGPDGRSVTDLTTSRYTPAHLGETIVVALRAQHQDVDLPSGRSIEAWTFGALAGPAIVARVGDTLSVDLANVDVDAGATVHWHGYPVANAFDGVAGVTQDAVGPREDFHADIPMTQAGTYWYHTHQRGSQGVVRGLYGTLVVQPETGQTEDVDLTLPVHTFSSTVVLGTSDVLEERVVAPGDSVRLRLINTDQTPQTFAVQGASFRVVALDGMDAASDFLRDRSLVVAAGGRIDVVLEMPASPVRVGVASDRSGGIGLVPRAGDDIPALGIPSIAFDPLADLIAGPRGTGAPQSPAAAAIDESLGGEGFDVERTLILDRLPRIVQGMPNYAYTVDGRVYPYIEPTVVDVGDTVRMRLVNRSFETHPMHPHGHSVRVLSVDGRAPTQPLWLDTFDVGPGEVWEVALYADNPGIWMDHCHNLEHAALGMVTHLAYRGITTPSSMADARTTPPSDERGAEMTEELRIFSGLQGFVSAAGLLALILFFALAAPFGSGQSRWAWFGPVNDWLYVLGAAPWIAASVLLVIRVRAGMLLWTLTVVLCVLVAAGAIVTALMLAGKVGLNVQFAVATPMTLVGFIWLWPAAAAAVSAAALPQWVLPFSIVVLLAFVAGGALVGAGFLLPAESATRMVLFVAGGVPVALAMVAFPAWWIVVASNVGRRVEQD